MPAAVPATFTTSAPTAVGRAAPLGKPQAGPLAYGPREVPVPYAVRWGREEVDVEGLTVKRDLAGRAYSLGYKDEEPYDRDRHGVLWNRMVSSPGVGRPHFASMHSHRQRRAMLGLLCQVCGGPADRTSRGWLFMTERDEKTQSSPHWPEGSLTTKPPVCGSCAEVALRYCPHLKDPVFIRSRKPRVWGVFGGFFTLTPANVLATSDDAYLPYGAPESPWFLAALVAVELTRCTLTAR